MARILYIAIVLSLSLTSNVYASLAHLPENLAYTIARLANSMMDDVDHCDMSDTIQSDLKIHIENVANTYDALSVALRDHELSSDTVITLYMSADNALYNLQETYRSLNRNCLMTSTLERMVAKNLKLRHYVFGEF